jgi:hypothetical protein
MIRQDGIENRIALFVADLQIYYTKELPKRGFLPFFGKFEVEYGKKYARIVKNEYQQSSVYCFIDLTNGNILKADGWKKPAKGARGSIWNIDYDVGNGKPCDLFGSGLYMR